ncbi:hypothetical protein ABGN05_14780 [Aquibium sp. LZ166]|uniref:Uncharacterized protein n=1 Tax=Aquibium pacificus TaxID=3153579 RepID=A0ABV3SK96_9HYPH
MNDNPSLQPDLRSDPASAEAETADTYELSLNPAEHSDLKAALASSPLAVLLDAAGHSEPCIRRVRSGRSLGCSCQTVPQPLDDAATAIGLAIRLAQMGAERQIPIPRGVLQALVRQVDAKNPAAILVWHWLARRGQVPARADVRPELRLVCERTQ